MRLCAPDDSWFHRYDYHGFHGPIAGPAIRHEMDGTRTIAGSEGQRTSVAWNGTTEPDRPNADNGGIHDEWKRADEGVSQMVSYMGHIDLSARQVDSGRATQIRDNVAAVVEEIRDTEAKAGRSCGDVRLLAATKTRTVGEIMAAIDAGIRLIGENRPQEVTAKAEGLQALCAERGLNLKADDGVGFHLIGQLQANKISKVLPYVGTIESVDNLQLAERISRRAVAHGLDVGMLLEVNESGESAKSGCEPEAAMELACTMASLPGLKLQGLMTIGAHVDDEGVIRKGFEHLRTLRDGILQSGESGTEDCRELSMGMTHDMKYAIREGSTIVRVGTAIFGPRAFI